MQLRSGCGVEPLAPKPEHGLGFRVLGLGFRVLGLGFRGLGFRV